MISLPGSETSLSKSFPSKVYLVALDKRWKSWGKKRHEEAAVTDWSMRHNSCLAEDQPEDVGSYSHIFFLGGCQFGIEHALVPTSV